MEGLGIVFAIVVIIVFVLAMRLFGAWMLRIDELIKLLYVIKEMVETKLSDEELEEVKTKLKKRG